MKNKPTSYARFYALLRQMQGDREQIKETLILQFTKGRTTSLREMQKDEYEAMCRAMEAEIEHPGLSTEEFRREQKPLCGIAPDATSRSRHLGLGCGRCLLFEQSNCQKGVRPAFARRTQGDGLKTRSDGTKRIFPAPQNNASRHC